jgi:hypothetical protein
MFIILLVICLHIHGSFLDTHKLAATIMIAVLRGERPLLLSSWSDEERQLWCSAGKINPKRGQKCTSLSVHCEIYIATCKSQQAFMPCSLQVESKETPIDLIAVQEWLRKE